MEAGRASATLLLTTTALRVEMVVAGDARDDFTALRDAQSL